MSPRPRLRYVITDKAIQPSGILSASLSRGVSSTFVLLGGQSKRDGYYYYYSNPPVQTPGLLPDAHASHVRAKLSTSMSRITHHRGCLASTCEKDVAQTQMDEGTPSLTHWLVLAIISCWLVTTLRFLLLASFAVSCSKLLFPCPHRFLWGVWGFSALVGIAGFFTGLLALPATQALSTDQRLRK